MHWGSICAQEHARLGTQRCGAWWEGGGICTVTITSAQRIDFLLGHRAKTRSPTGVGFVLNLRSFLKMCVCLTCTACFEIHKCHGVSPQTDLGMLDVVTFVVIFKSKIYSWSYSPCLIEIGSSLPNNSLPSHSSSLSWGEKDGEAHERCREYWEPGIPSLYQGRLQRVERYSGHSQ